MNATIESHAIIAFEKGTGKEAWRFKVDGRSWSTPALVPTAQGTEELVVNAENRVSGLDPATGKELWWCNGISDYTCPSVLPGNGVAYVSGGRQNQMLAIRTGGKGNVTDSHVLWRQRIGANVPSPVLLGNRLYGVADRGAIAYAVDAENGKIVYQQRLSASNETPIRPAAFQQPGKKRGGPGGFGGGGFGGGGLQFYASFVAADNKIFAVSRTEGTFVLAPGDELKIVSKNRIEADKSNFDATPAIADGKIYLRSNDALYCIGAK